MTYAVSGKYASGGQAATVEQDTLEDALEDARYILGRTGTEVTITHVKDEPVAEVIPIAEYLKGKPRGTRFSATGNFVNGPIYLNGGQYVDSTNNIAYIEDHFGRLAYTDFQIKEPS